jgi:energy-coupling factor transporter ATP-binding protein EcfA2
MSGICNSKFIKGKGMPNTEKFLIIGPSGSGKTTLAVNLIVYTIKSFGGIVFIIPKMSQKDEPITTLEYYCKEAKIPVYLLDVNDISLGQIPEIEGGGVYVIDDYYLSSGRDTTIERLLMEMVNKGRKLGMHVLYLAQLATRLPAEIKNNNSGIYLSSEIINKPKIYESLNISKPDIIPKTSKHRWYSYENDELIEQEFVSPEKSNEIKEILEAKVPEEIKKKQKKYTFQGGLKNAMKCIKDSANMGNNIAQQYTGSTVGKGKHNTIIQKKNVSILDNIGKGNVFDKPSDLRPLF